MTKYIIYLFTLISVAACNTSTQSEPSIYEGTVNIAVDESLKPIIDAQIAAYVNHYPKAKIIPTYTSEQKAINDLFKDSVTIAVTTRAFNENEMKVLKSREIRYIETRMAIDAVVLIVNKNSSDSTLTLEQIKTYLTDKNSKKKLVFDRANSSNLSILMEKLNIKEINTDNIFSADGNLNVIESVEKNPSLIGFIGYNWISDVNDKASMDRKNRIKVLGVAVNKDSNAYKPTFKNLKARNYPLERFIFLHSMKKDWGVENGFIRFSCSKIGQLVTEKMELVPFYIIPKEFILNTKPIGE